ncbi:unnamed protein product [Trifolium pratense]|uniref:Uncharacterized protein n=1 Tax=Trifolium pratense TaxID=57577 RepID=A0ACB0KFL0_TRIPR|nr:unnamed protein product [Trifolium pratense]
MAESTNNTFVQPSIPKFEGHYDHWSMLMENFLRSKEYWNLIEDGVFVPPPAANAEQLKKGEESKLKDFKVKNYLFQAIDRTIMETILLKDSAKGIWDSMKQKYRGSNKVKRAHLQALCKELELLEMKDGETVNEYFARTLSIINKMKIHGERVEPVTIVEKILRSMTPKFNYVVCAIEESNDVTALSVDELQSSLIVHEQRMKGQREEDQILKVINAGRTNNRGRGRGGFRGGRGRGRQSFNKDNIECYHCHKLGHFQSDCPAWDEKANYAEFDEGEEMLLMAHSEKGSYDKKVWFLDSGCRNHMCGTKDWFFNLDEQFRISVKLGDNSRMMVVGKGNVKLRIGGITQVITNVYYIPELKNNLLSIGQLQEKGLTVVFKEDMCRVYHQERGVIMQCKMTANRMYVIMVDVVIPTCFKVTNEDVTYLWHCRYGYLSQKGLKILEQKNMVRGLPKLQDSSNVCSDCMIGKQHREPFLKVSTRRATKRLQLIHADVFGPIKPESNSNKRYFLTFIDDFSRKTWVYFLSEKSSVLEMFKKFKAMVEKETSDAICCLRTDRGGEFTSTDFNTFCSLHGIKRQLTVAYTPHQNGVVERKNRTIMNMVRSMLSGKGIPKKFWAEAVNWSVFVQNRSPTVAVKDMTPEEAWSGLKPAVHFFKVFGCIGYVHVSDAQRKKLDNKSVKCILLGISEESKAYKLYDPISRKVIVSRDVVFAENEKWNWKTNENDNIDLEDLSEKEEAKSHNEPAEDNNTPNPHNEQGSSSEEVGNQSNTSSENEDLGTRARRPPGWLNDFEVVQNAKGISISQAKYVRDILERFDMLNCNAVQCPTVPGCKLTKEGGGENVDVTRFKQIIGRLMHLIATRPNIMFAVCLISRYMEKPTDVHLLAAKKVLRYVKGTMEFGVQYLKSEEHELLAYTDSDNAGDIDDRKSTFGDVFMLEARVISWSSKKQPVVTLSTTEVEFIAATSCACQVVLKVGVDMLGVCFYLLSKCIVPVYVVFFVIIAPP